MHDEIPGQLADRERKSRGLNIYERVLIYGICLTPLLMMQLLFWRN